MVWLSLTLCLAFLLPNHYSPWLSFHQEALAAIAFFPLMLLAVIKCRGNIWIEVAIFFLALIPLAQSAAGLIYFSGDAWMAFAYITGAALAVHSGKFVTQETTAKSINIVPVLSLFWAAFIFAGLISVAIAAHQWLGLNRLALFVLEIASQGRPYANLAQPNQLATLLLLGITGCIFLWEHKKIKSFTTFVAIILMTTGLVMTQSRSVLLAILWIVPLFFLLRNKSKLRISFKALISIIIYYIILSISWTSLNEFLLLDQGSDSSIKRMRESGVRSVYWHSMLDAITRKPWSGYGWGQVGIAQTDTALNYPPTHSFFDSAHNIVLDLMLWNGVPIATLFILLSFFWAINHLRKCDNSTSWTSLLGVGIIVSHSMLEYPLNYTFFLFPIGFLVGVLSSEKKSTIDFTTKSSLKIQKISIRIFTCTALTVSILSIIDYIKFEESWRALRFQEAGIGNIAPPKMSEEIILNQLGALIKFARTDATTSMSEDDLLQMRKVSQRYAYSSSMFRYALAQALNGNNQGAHDTLRKLCKMHPKQKCIDARDKWDEFRKTIYPQLSKAPFPDIAISDLEN